MPNITLYGFDGSTYVRTVKMLLAEKGVTDFTQVPINVLKGEPREAENLGRHPFGKVPTVSVDGFEIIETTAITRYLNEKLPGPSLIPGSLNDRARMDMAVAVIDSYGYGSLAGGVAAYYLFADLFGGKTEAMRTQGLEKGQTVLSFLMKLRGQSDWLAGDTLSLADLMLAPILAYVAMTPDADALLGEERVADWWRRMQAQPCFVSTVPAPG